MLNYALLYLKLGLSIIPLKPRGKEPLIPWIEFQKRKATESEIRSWFQKWPNANIGVVTGSVAGIVVVDLDGPEGIASAGLLNLSSNIMSLTGGGKHLWFKYPKDGKVANAVRIVPGVDIRAEGGFVVAPPSIHESGRRYRWLKSFTSLVTLLPVPAILVAQPVITVPLKFKEEGWSEQSPARQRLDIAKALEEMKDGNIDNTITSILGRLRHDGYTAADSKALLLPHMERVGAEQGHLEVKIKNIWSRYEASSKQSSPISSSGYGTESSGLIIHSPTNPDSIKQYEYYKMGTKEFAGTYLNTGYSKLDQMLFGGLKSSRLFTVAARTGVGKTNWLLGVAREVCRAGKVVLLFSTEMPYVQIWERYIQTFENPEEFKNHKFFVCDSFAPSVEKVEEALNECRPDLFMFDHINHIGEEPREIGAFMQGLNYLRRKYECAGIITAQLNRQADWVDLKTGEKIVPRMSMIKGSGTIEQASSRVLLLSETRVTPEMTEIVGNLDKNDNGPKGLIHFGLLNKPYKMVEL